MVQSSPIPSLMDRVPQEIHDMIIDIAAALPGAYVLKSASLVCRAWEAASRSHLFSSDFDFCPESISFLANGAAERILNSIREARFEDSYRYAYDWNLEALAIQMGEDMQKILPKMTNLYSLAFLCCDAKLVISLVGKAFKGNEKITELRIWSSEEENPFPSYRSVRETIAHFPALEMLDWNNSILGSTEDEATEFSAPVPPNLRTVDLGEEGVYDILDWLVEGGAAGSIQCLAINTLFDDELHFIRHFARLEHLSLPGILPSDERCEGEFERMLAPCSRLKALQLGIRVSFPNFGRDALTPPDIGRSSSDLQVQSPESGKVPWYSELLAGISSPVLSKLWLRVHYEEHPQDPLDPMDWKTLNTLLQTSQSYAQLKELEIYAGGLSGRQRSSAEDCEKWIRKELNGVRSGIRLLVKAW
ncbi:hypothetical protein DFP72DRAFT_225320 [Ephemerocybe angulata]|uniref:F-box domain-containing protein n=1 Tax=Ephemerocybe angulata TaxID=980116 RepID=A0A8H6M6Q1_9AGAR|nr:hypothetical protein DFP72DRAFT_225320 [Tulosesus angulatus]